MWAEGVSEWERIAKGAAGAERGSTREHAAACTTAAGHGVGTYGCGLGAQTAPRVGAGCTTDTSTAAWGAAAACPSAPPQPVGVAAGAAGTCRRATGRCGGGALAPVGDGIGLKHGERLAIPTCSALDVSCRCLPL